MCDLWHSLGATESQIQCLILLNAEICMREEAEAIEVWSPSFRDHSKQSGKGTTSSLLDKYDFVTPSQ